MLFIKLNLLKKVFLLKLKIACLDRVSEIDGGSPLIILSFFICIKNRNSYYLVEILYMQLCNA